MLGAAQMARIAGSISPATKTDERYQLANPSITLHVPPAYRTAEKLDIGGTWYLLQRRPRASIDPAPGALVVGADLHLIICKTFARFIRGAVLLIELLPPKLQICDLSLQLRCAMVRAFGAIARGQLKLTSNCHIPPLCWRGTRWHG